jgi:hypothetical protein
MGLNKRITYSKEIEAAWYAVIRFISPFDYVLRYIDKNDQKQIVTANPNCVLAARMSKFDLFRPFAIDKSMLQEHFNRNTIIFYKSAPNSKLSIGYGRYDKNALSLSFSADLGVTSKRTTDKRYFVLLIGIDIDCHNGERHVHEVEELIKKYLPDSYWEDSTNGKGRHGYLKIKFINSFGVIETISNSLTKLLSKLNELKNLYRYEANVDEPAGLPYKLELKDENPYIDNWNTLFWKSGKENKFLGRFINYKSKMWKDYIGYLKNYTIHYIPGKGQFFPYQLDKYLSEEDIKKTFSEFLSANNIVFSPPTKNGKYYKITYQRAFKLPMFGAAASDYNDASPSMDCIKQFHDLPYYTSSELKTIYVQIIEDIKAFEDTSANLYFVNGYHFSSGSLYIDNKSNSHFSSSEPETDIYSFPIPVKGEDKAPSTRSRCSLVTGTFNQTTQTVKTTETIEISSIKKEEEKLGNNCACTNTQERAKINSVDTPNIDEKPKYAEVVEWSEFEAINGDFEINVFWDKYEKDKKTSKGCRYEEIINKLKNENNTMKRSSLFIRAYINKLGRIPTVDEAEREYVERGLNRNNASTTLNRRNRFKGCIDYYSREYDESEAGFKLKWSEEKKTVLELIKTHLPKELTYKQGKRIKCFSPEEAGFVYYVISRMDESDQYFLLANSLTYNRADELFMAEFGVKCGRHKFSGIIKLLLNCGLIEKVGNYKVGLRGNCYRVRIG